MENNLRDYLTTILIRMSMIDQTYWKNGNIDIDLWSHQFNALRDEAVQKIAQLEPTKESEVA